MRTAISRVCVLALILAFTPGAGEAVENLGHLIGQGHLAHAEQTDDHHEPTGEEHGCTSTFHLCSCHTSLSFLVAEGRPSSVIAPTGFRAISRSGTLPTGFGPSVERPPRI